jgi:adenylate cyclase
MAKKIRQITEEEWREMLTRPGGHSSMAARIRHLFARIPSNPRCKVCNAPFGGIGGVVFRIIGAGPFEKNPNFCGNCTFQGIGGAEIEITALFADVRGSTTLGEKLSANEFTTLMNRFYQATTEVLVKSDAWLDKLVGDEVIGLYIPAYAGPQHAHKAVHAAQDLLRATGHQHPSGPWIPVGVGIHTGLTYVGMVGVEGGISDLTALGDTMNTAARLSSQARAGEILVTRETCVAAGWDTSQLEHRQLELRGKTQATDVSVIRVNSPAHAQ